MRKSIGAASEKDVQNIKKVIICLNEEIKIIRTVAFTSLILNMILWTYIILIT